MPTEAPSERRAHDRMPLVRGCKLLDQKSAKFIPAETANISQGGLLMRVPAARPFSAGDRVEVAVGWGNIPIAASVKMAAATVVRVLDIDHAHQGLALKYDHAEAISGEALAEAEAAAEADALSEPMKAAA